MNNKPKILLWDIETFPIESYTWGLYEQNVIAIKRDWELASFAYKYLGEKEVRCVTRQDYSDKTDKSLAKELYKVLSEADILVAHNGDEFDLKKSKARFIHHGLEPLPPVKTVDTKKLAKRHFNFSSNSLDNLGDYLGLGRKVQTGGFQLWLDCLKGKKEAWAKMSKYNKQDVILLEKVYLKLRPWGNHPNIALINKDTACCTRCGSKHLKSYGWIHTNMVSYRKMRCLDCKGYMRTDEKYPSKQPLRSVA